MSRLAFQLEDIAAEVAELAGGIPSNITLVLDDRVYDAVSGGLCSHFGWSTAPGDDLRVGTSDSSLMFKRS